VKRILVSNDDGIHAPGLEALVRALEPLGEVTVVAPLTEQSAASHALTLHRPLRIEETGPRRYGVEGTPTDCVLLAVRELLQAQPHLVVSGINQGPNLGEDVLYSGTVAAAMEGSLLGTASMAVSLASWKFRDYRGAVEAVSVLAAALLAGAPERFLLNVNVPPLPREQIRGFRAVRLGSRVYNDAIVRKRDPRGRDYYWIGGAEPSWERAADTDFAAVEDGFVSLTPLLLDLTSRQGFDYLASLDLEWP
jgi:5'-nucleotidase